MYWLLYKFFEHLENENLGDQGESSSFSCSEEGAGKNRLPPPHNEEHWQLDCTKQQKVEYWRQAAYF